MRSKLGLGIVVTLVFFAGLWISYQWFGSKSRESQQVESTVLLERIREVFQLVTVEGQFSELYTETNIKEVTLYLPIPTYWEFSKKALLEVKGKVLVGYDMEQVSIKVDSMSRQIVLNNLPEPSILAIDHEISYRNLEESFFNSFTPEDYTQLNRNAKEVLRRKAEESDLLNKAREEGNAMLDAITFMAQSIGWEVIYDKEAGRPAKPALTN
jgi:hypothetical protein